MKNIKKVFAILGIVLILGLNLFLVFAAGTANQDGASIFEGAVVAVVMVPILLWIYMYVFKLIKKRKEDEKLEKELDK